ncbi:lactococcin 972 family bacteriocin [Corynebacterium sp. H128]|uniref:lactococcin 972 family bacteriocin n=1 Tax=unclassified Corynebacterium TaxID=2624378 RepID=UPI00309D3FE8
MTVRLNSQLRKLTIGAAIATISAMTALGSAGFAGATGDQALPENTTEWGSEVADDNAGIVQPRATDHPEGGTWNYGTTGPNGGGVVYSDFLHDSRPHGSSVTNAHGETDRSAVFTGGAWSHAELPAVENEVDQSFYWFAD